MEWLDKARTVRETKRDGERQSKSKTQRVVNREKRTAKERR